MKLGYYIAGLVVLSALTCRGLSAGANLLPANAHTTETLATSLSAPIEDNPRFFLNPMSSGNATPPYSTILDFGM